MNVLLRKINSAYYRYRGNRWRWHPRFRNDDVSIQIDRPIFLLGTQGGGLTLTTRILRRHPDIVSVAGDCNHWAGPDEMHLVMPEALPEALDWPDASLAGQEPGPNSWLYACDELLPHYRQDESGATPEMRDAFRSVLRRLIRLSGRSPLAPIRFLDMSQTNTVRVGLLNEALRDCHPKFVLLTRNPFAMCWRSTRRVADVVRLDRSEEEKLEIAVQHWKNSMTEALAYEGRADLAWWRFEDLVSAPEKILREICSFLELPFRPEILPGPEDKFPFGSASDAFDGSKWYPMRPNVNERYLREIPTWASKVVSQQCASLLDRFGYESPHDSNTH